MSNDRPTDRDTEATKQSSSEDNRWLLVGGQKKGGVGGETGKGGLGGGERWKVLIKDNTKLKILL